MRALLRTLLGCAPALALLFALWLPVLRHYSVTERRFSPAELARAWEEPPAERLDRLEDLRSARDPLEPAALLRAADQLLNGRLELPPHPTIPLHLPFDPRDLESVSPALQLELAGGVVPDLLVRAHAQGGERRHLDAAARVIQAWDRDETARALPLGYSLSEHALALRVEMLASFWRAARAVPDLDPQIAAATFRMADRALELLARASHYTYQSNHAVLQSLAIWHGCLAFPWLERCGEATELALARLEEHLEYWVSRAGVVLEHSPGYQRFGAALLARATRYLELLERPPPPRLVEAAERSQRVLAVMRRPDGSLPEIGDTEVGARPPGESAGATPPHMLNLYAAEGNAVLWDGLAAWPDGGRLTQTMLTWSSFPSASHKHADELGLVLWARGRTWWTHVGYWPYGDRRGEALGWDGSNAPHPAGESADAPRRSELLGVASGARMGLIDVERRGPNDLRVRRQLLRAEPELWFVLDCFEGERAPGIRTVWTAEPTLRIEPGPLPQSFALRSPDSDLELRTVLLGAEGARIRVARGELDPWLGWVALAGRSPVPADALLVELPESTRFAGALFTLVPSGAAWPALPPALDFEDAERWTLLLGGSAGESRIARSDAELELTRPGQRVREDVVPPPPDAAQERDRILAAYRRAGASHATFQPRLSARRRLSLAAIACVVMQELGLAALRPRFPRASLWLRRLAPVLWIAGSLALLAGVFPDTLVPFRS